jgi:protein-S-isoprenylcysteine O-methyltransferase Ste14
MQSANVKAFGGLIFVLLIMGALLFLSAWTLEYWQAWTFLAVFGVSGLVITLYLMKKNPELLARRTQGGPLAEKETNQKIIQSITSAGFVSILVVSALDHRFGWSSVPRYLPFAGDALVLSGWLIIFFVFRQNSFASATIELAPEQKVISTGLYGIVRHPMYLGGSFYLLGMPLALGSWRGLLPLSLIMPTLIWRLFDEEKFLSRSLPGYSEYLVKVRHRLVPGVW